MIAGARIYETTVADQLKEFGNPNIPRSLISELDSMKQIDKVGVMLELLDRTIELGGP